MPSKAKILKRKITDAIINALTGPLVSLVGSCSEHGAERLANCLGKVVCAIKPGAYKIIMANLALAFPEKTREERERIAVLNVHHTIRFAIDFLRVLKRPELVRELMLPPDPLFKETGDKGGSILSLPHLGNWEILGQGGPCYGVKSAAVAEMLRNAKLNTLVEAARAQNGLLIIPREGAARKVLKALHDGYMIGFLADQNLSPDDGGVFLEFFGLPAPSAILHAALARRLHLPVIVGACIRLPDGHFQFKIRPLPKPVDDYPDNESLAQAMLKINEDFIREYPEQYLWTYHRWRYIPSNASEAFARKFPFYAAKRPYPCPQGLLAKLDN